MDYEKLNPCGREPYVWLVQWAETGCWCCTATRALVVGIVAGVIIGLLCAGAWPAALIVLGVGSPLLVTLLAVARSLWQDSYAKDSEESKS